MFITTSVVYNMSEEVTCFFPAPCSQLSADMLYWLVVSIDQIYRRRFHCPIAILQFDLGKKKKINNLRFCCKMITWKSGKLVICIYARFFVCLRKLSFHVLIFGWIWFTLSQVLNISSSLQKQWQSDYFKRIIQKLAKKDSSF